MGSCLVNYNSYFPALLPQLLVNEGEMMDGPFVHARFTRPCAISVCSHYTRVNEAFPNKFHYFKTSSYKESKVNDQ